MSEPNYYTSYHDPALGLRFSKAMTLWPHIPTQEVKYVEELSPDNRELWLHFAKTVIHLLEPRKTSGWQIALICIAVIVIVILVCFIIYIVWKKKIFSKN